MLCQNKYFDNSDFCYISYMIVFIEVCFGWRLYGQVILYLGNKIGFRDEIMYVIKCNIFFNYEGGRYLLGIMIELEF